MATVLMIYAQQRYWMALKAKKQEGFEDRSALVDEIKESMGLDNHEAEDLLDRTFPGEGPSLIASKMPFWVRKPSDTSVAEVKDLEDVRWIESPTFNDAYKARMPVNQGPEKEQYPDPLDAFRGYPFIGGTMTENMKMYKKLSGLVTETWFHVSQLSGKRPRDRREKAIYFQLGEDKVQAWRLLRNNLEESMDQSQSQSTSVPLSDGIIFPKIPPTESVIGAGMDDATSDPEDVEVAKNLDMESDYDSDQDTEGSLLILNKKERLQPSTPITDWPVPLGDINKLDSGMTSMVLTSSNFSGYSQVKVYETCYVGALRDGTLLEKFVSLLPYGYLITDSKDHLQKDPWGGVLYSALGLNDLAVSLPFKPADLDPNDLPKTAITPVSLEATLSTGALKFVNPRVGFGKDGRSKTAGSNESQQPDEAAMDEWKLVDKYGLVILRPYTPAQSGDEVSFGDMLTLFGGGKLKVDFGDVDKERRCKLSGIRNGLYLQADAFGTSYLRLEVDVMNLWSSLVVLFRKYKIFPLKAESQSSLEVTHATFTGIRKTRAFRAGKELISSTSNRMIFSGILTGKSSKEGDPASGTSKSEAGG